MIQQPQPPEITRIPLILPVFNQLTYLKNLINWFRWYYPSNQVIILDNASDYGPLLNFYDTIGPEDNIRVERCDTNNCPGNLADFLAVTKFEYYIISDPDIMPHPATPPNFIEIFKSYIDIHKFHRVGFGLITSDIPDWIHDKAMIQGNEAELLNNQVTESHDFPGFKAPIDTTFCLYTSHNSGWRAPMDGKDWGNCLRLFQAFHLGWYIHPDNLNPEMVHYFSTAKYRVPGEVSAGSNNNRPKKFIKE